jgi:hypothetical protein
MLGKHVLSDVKVLIMYVLFLYRSPPTEAATLSNHPPTSSSHPTFHRSMSQPSDLHTEEGSIWGGAQPVPPGKSTP